MERKILISLLRIVGYGLLGAAIAQFVVSQLAFFSNGHYHFEQEFVMFAAFVMAGLLCLSALHIILLLEKLRERLSS